jgi:peptidoglycan/LPS O-acetylase OafA/YrhL
MMKLPAELFALCKKYLRMERVPSAIKSLDGLRGIAIILVLLRHAVGPFYNSNDPDFTIAGWDPLIPLRNGWMGVDLFFVLSGFLITQHLLRSAGSQSFSQTFSRYFKKRMLRIVPAYYVVLIAVSAGLLPLYPLPDDGLGQEFILNLLFLQDYSGSKIVVAFWSLGVEEKFYLLAPMLVLLLLRIRGAGRRVLCLCILIAIPVALRALTFFSHPEIDTYRQLFWTLRSPFHLAVDSLLMGTMCALLIHHREEFKWLQSNSVRRASLLGGCSIILVLLIRAPLLDTPSTFNGTILFPLIAFGFSLILLSMVIDPDKRRPVLDSHFLFFFAKISYCLYLVHGLFIYSVGRVMLDYMPWLAEISNIAGLMMYLPILSIVSIAAALTLHYAIEKPFLILKNRER